MINRMTMGMAMDGNRTGDARIAPGARIGHVHLKVADIDRALAFYCDVLGFGLTQRYGPDAAFVAAGFPYLVCADGGDPSSVH